MTLSRRALLASTALVVARPVLAQQRAAYRDRALPIPARVADLLGRMTLEEKAAQLCCLWAGKTRLIDRTSGLFDPARAKAAIPDGIGQIARPSDTFGTASGLRQPFREPADAVAFINGIQRHCVDMNWSVEPGSFRISAGNSSAALKHTQLVVA